MKINNQQKNSVSLSPSQGGPASPKLRRSGGGFTLVELMVATFIFMAVMLASMGALLVTIDGARNARGLRTAMDNVNFAMESMTRSIRMGTNYVCADTIVLYGEGISLPEDCPSGGTSMAFLPQKSDPDNKYLVGYKLTQRDDGSYTLQRCEGNALCVDVVAGEVNIEKLNFVVKDSPRDDQIQASVYIIMKGQVDVKGVITPFTIQTLATQRNF